MIAPGEDGGRCASNVVLKPESQSEGTLKLLVCGANGLRAFDGRRLRGPHWKSCLTNSQRKYVRLHARKGDIEFEFFIDGFWGISYLSLLLIIDFVSPSTFTAHGRHWVFRMPFDGSQEAIQSIHPVPTSCRIPSEYGA